MNMIIIVILLISLFNIHRSLSYESYKELEERHFRLHSKLELCLITSRPKKISTSLKTCALTAIEAIDSVICY